MPDPISILVSGYRISSTKGKGQLSRFAPKRQMSNISTYSVDSGMMD